MYDIMAIKRAMEASRAKLGNYLEMLAPENQAPVIDEMAILFDEVMAMERFLDSAGELGWLRPFPNNEQNFGHDWVTLSPWEVRSRVEYRWRDAGDYRVETVMPLGGFNPVFEAARHSVSPALAAVRQLGLVVQIHASFKARDMTEYLLWCSLLQQKGLVPGQSCISSYGEFSYYIPKFAERDAFSLPYMWLKPRVNLRDGA